MYRPWSVQLHQWNAERFARNDWNGERNAERFARNDWNGERFALNDSNGERNAERFCMERFERRTVGTLSKFTFRKLSLFIIVIITIYTLRHLFVE
jgi:hypothetical protein